MTQERSSRIDGNPIETSARLAMLRDVEDLSRRRLLQMGGAFASAAAMFAAGVPLVGVNAQSDDATPTTELPDVTDFPENLKGEGEVVVASWGGTFQAAQREAYFEPFQELSGITVIEAEGPSIAQVQAMVDTGNIEWDVVQLDRASVMNLEQKGDYWEPIDYSLFDTDNIDEERRYTFSVDMLPYAQIIGYRTDEFPEGPGSWADFWDVDAFPGPRTMIGGGGLWPYLEAALMAEGVAKEDLYPIDIDRAYASLDNIRGDVVRWWDAGAIPAQMLTDKEALLAVIWNGRMQALLDEGVPVAPVWNQGGLFTDVWAIPKGAPNAENAQKFAAFITMAVPQARLSKLIPYGSVNNESAQYMSEEELNSFISGPAISEQMFTVNTQWWVENLDEVLDLWNEWVLG